MDTELSTRVLLPQGPKLQLLSSDQGRLQEQQQHGTLALYQNQQFDDMAPGFLIQDMPVQGSQVLLPHGPAAAELEEDLAFDDYIDDGDDNEVHSHVHGHGHSLDSLPSGTHARVLSPGVVSALHALRQSPVSDISSPAFSSHSPSSPSYPCSPPLSSLHQGVQDDLIGDTLLIKEEEPQAQDSTVIGAIHVKQEVIDSSPLLDPSGYMDTSIELYGSAHSPLLTSQADLITPAPQDLFRMLDELQTHAAIQQEKFFSATTGSGTGMDSVEFLFNGPQSEAQAQAQVPIHVQEPALTQVQGCSKPMPHFMTEETAGAGVASTESCVNMESRDVEFSNPGSVSRPSMEVDDCFELSGTPSSATLLSAPASRNGLEGVMMETAGGLPSSPSSPSSTVTPELTPPALLPKQGNASRSTTRKQKKATTLVTKPTLQSAIENWTPRTRTADELDKETPLSPGTSGTITIRPAPTKRRKLSHGSVHRDSSESPRLNALPSPPSSVRTTPPLPPSMIDTAVHLDKLDLPPACIAGEFPSTDVTSQPITPTSPLPSNAQKLGRLSKSSRIDKNVEPVTVVRSTGSSSSSSGPKSGKKNAPPNANNKRPWTAQEEKLLLQLVEGMIPIKEIAETLDRSVHSVRSRRQVLTDPGFVKGNGHAQPRRSKPDPSYKLPTYSQMAFLSLARLPELQGTLNDVAGMVEKLFSRYLNRIPRTGHKNLQIWRAQISDALAHEKGHPRPRFESFGVKRGRQWVYRLTDFGKGVMKAMGGVDHICDELLKNNERMGPSYGPDGESAGIGGAEAGLGQGNGYGYSYSHETTYKCENSGSFSSSPSSDRRSSVSLSGGQETSADDMAASNAIANAMAAMAAGLAAMTAVEDERSAAAAVMGTKPSSRAPGASSEGHSLAREKTGKGKHGSSDVKAAASASGTTRSGRKTKA
ncbi:hypothetical protein BGX34_001955 [Mortierella sp. NVP85]|nr:hypothetical protein BGX34_001955 [Mortierella sp. NVP85]